ncbi:hypothetical protein BKA66DRAFT_440049 [Pyrenochaeta sp. MPI-SDFR-AT-0127]|nr:hypothetical protein BKA66DRAFT_440049 [Pyrenochaeta sp. MPI-SDFR-AT-0127]
MQTTAASAQATIQIFHARVAAAEKQGYITQAAINEQQFQDTYSPCNALSLLHDLQCGHRIQTEYLASCGVLCVRPTGGPPFVCPTCLIDVVRAEVALEDLTLQLNDDISMKDNSPTQEEKARRFADKYVQAMVKKGYRTCKVVSKLDEPRLQFFDQFMREDGFGGVEDKPEEEESPRLHKRPSMSAHKNFTKQDIGSGRAHQSSGKWDFRGTDFLAERHEGADVTLSIDTTKQGSERAQRGGEAAMDSLPEHFADSHVDLPPEDDATEAVRKAIEMFALM